LENIEVSETVTRRDHAERVREYYRQQGAEREQQRIIKLLEENAHTEELLSVGFYEPEPIIYLNTAIALIKGDN